MSATILFNDGEGVEHDDFNTLQDYQKRTLFDQLLWAMAAETEAPGVLSTSQIQEAWTPASGLYGGLMRPLRGAGAFRLNGTDIEIAGGTWIQMPSGGAADADTNVCLVARSSFTTLSGPAAAAAGLYRRDIIEARIVSNNAASVNRDFEDAVTGALTTSAQVKRSDLEVEIQFKTGSTETSLANASDPSQMDSPTAGWTVIAGILVDDTGTVTTIEDHWDFRRPWGRWRHNVNLRAVAGLGSGDWSDLREYISSASAPDLFTAYLAPTESLSIIGEGINSTEWRNMRISTVKLACSFLAAPAINNLQFKRRTFPGGFLGLTNVGTNNAGGVGDRVTGAAAHAAQASYGLYNTTGTLFNMQTDVPFWLTGTPNAYVGSTANEQHAVPVLDIVSGTTGDRLWGLIVEGWGGF